MPSDEPRQISRQYVLAFFVNAVGNAALLNVVFGLLDTVPPLDGLRKHAKIKVLPSSIIELGDFLFSRLSLEYA